MRRNITLSRPIRQSPHFFALLDRQPGIPYFCKDMSIRTNSPWQIAQDAVASQAQASLGAAVALKPTPDSGLGDLAIPCFGQAEKDPGKAAADLATKLSQTRDESIASVAAAGPYVNVFLNRPLLANRTIDAAGAAAFGHSDILNSSTVVLEFSSPNT
jgi:arginyl-tRNA synthetase